MRFSKSARRLRRPSSRSSHSSVRFSRWTSPLRGMDSLSYKNRRRLVTPGGEQFFTSSASIVGLHPVAVDASRFAARWIVSVMDHAVNHGHDVLGYLDNEA